MKIFLFNSNERHGAIKIQKSGFTFIELMIVITITSVILGGIMQFLATISRSYTKEVAITEAQQNLRSCIEFMARTIQNAGLDPLGTAGAGIVAATANSIQFTSDLERDGTVTGTLEDITYTYNAGNRNIMITDDVGTETLIDNVTVCTFTYFGVTPTAYGVNLGSTPADLSVIRSVDIMVTVSEPAGRAGIIIRTLNIRANCRNLSPV